jgi:hypothetical protein
MKYMLLLLNLIEIGIATQEPGQIYHYLEITILVKLDIEDILAMVVVSLTGTA